MASLPVLPALLALCLVGSMAVSAQAPLSVTQGRASQRAGTKLVDVYYDVSGGLSPYTVTVQGSTDGGATWNLPVTAVSGNVGGVTAGANRKVTWNAGTDWAGQVSANVKFRVNVTDSATPPAPDGFALIPAGSFQMGDQSNPLVGSSGELPVHSVYVSAFYMGKYEVTKELWDTVRAWGLNNGYTDLPGGNGTYISKGANHPVHSINWYSMVKWCNARSQKEGFMPCYSVSAFTYKTGDSVPDCNWSVNGYRLPSEAEWEKAARGGLSGHNFPWGNTISHSQANYCVNSLNGTTNDYSYDESPTQGYHPTYATGLTPYTSPAGSFAPNGYGLYDMAGNVWEWCWDSYGSYPSTAQTDPLGPVSGWLRVNRGGSWGTVAFGCRVADRGYFSPAAAGNIFGFRIARSSVPE